MPDQTGIEWTDATWNPVTGCTEVSPGCAHCYAKTFAERWRGKEDHPYEMGFDLTLRPERLDQPRRWRKPRMIFVNSMSDLFHEGIPWDFIVDVYKVMFEADQHIYQVLTKRSERFREFFGSGLPLGDGPQDETEYWQAMNRKYVGEAPHIWHGVSVENQRFADIRIPHLLSVPAAVRFLSCEPLLGPLDLTPYLERLQWVIVGGESGPKARPANPHWVREIKDQCVRYGVPFFFKQWGELAPLSQLSGIIDRTEEHHRIDYARLGKNKSGAMLDRREWRQMPR